MKSNWPGWVKRYVMSAVGAFCLSLPHCDLSVSFGAHARPGLELGYGLALKLGLGQLNELGFCQLRVLSSVGQVWWWNAPSWTI